MATLVIAAIGAPLTKLALLFGPAEYFGLMVFGLGLAIVLARGSVLKAVIMVVLGLLLATVGTDLETGQDRLTLGIAELSDGVDFAVLAMGVFGIAEILRNLENPGSRATSRVSQIGRLLPSLDELRRSLGPIVRGDGHRLDSRHPAGQRRGARAVRLLRAGKEARRKTPRASARARSRAWRARRAPTTPARRPRSFRC